MTEDTHIDVAVIGYGLGGRVFHAPFIRLATGLRLRGVCTRDADRQRQAREDLGNIVVYPDLDAVLDDAQVDLVVLATPHDTHAPLSIKAMDSGKHLVTDKVMCMSEAEARDMIDAARHNGVMLSVFQNRRWDGDFLTLCRLIDGGILGEVRGLESNITGFGGPPPGWRAWRRHGGGRTRDWAAHLVDQAMILFGPDVVSVYADYQYCYDPAQSDVESAAEVWIVFEGGVRFAMSLGNEWMFPKPRYELRAERGGFRKWGVDPQESAIKLGNVGLPVPEDPARYELDLADAAGGGKTRIPVVPEPGNYRAYYDNIARVLLEDEQLLVEPDECLKAIRIIDAIVASAATGEVVRPTSRGDEV